MEKLLSGLMFILMSAILYSANVISVTISKLDYGGQSEIGYSLIILSVVSLVVGIILLLMAERDVKYGKRETEEPIKS